MHNFDREFDEQCWLNDEYHLSTILHVYWPQIRENYATFKLNENILINTQGTGLRTIQWFRITNRNWNKNMNSGNWM